MDVKKRIDKILGSVHDQVKEEVGVLLGVEISVSNARAELVTKEAFFDNLMGKQILAKIDVAGEVEGVGCLVIGIKDAIRLGGTLIMLPDSELEEVVGREEYTEESEDSYGEIANIIAGSFTKVFEEMFPKSCRFIRKEQEMVVPVKVDIESDEPIPDQQYYQVSIKLAMADRQMGDLHMLMPALAFGLVQEEVPQEQEAEAESTVESAQQDSEVEAAPESGDEVPEAAEVAGAPSKKTIDPLKHTKRIDKILASCEQKLSEELSSLLGVEITFSGLKNRHISKEEFFFEEVEGKQISANMDVVGDQQGKSYFFASLKDSIHLGGVLIMLPPSELELVVSEEEFSEDLKDSYGEIANIVSGVYTSVFEEQYNENLRFIKKDLHHIVPMKVNIESSEPIADDQYYMSCMALNVDGKDLGKVRMMFPAAMLHIAEADQVVQDVAAESGQQAKSEQAEAKAPDADVQQQDQPDTTPSTTAAAPGPKFDIVKHKKRVDKLLKECVGKMKEEVGALLGAEIELIDQKNSSVSKEDFFFDTVNGKQVMANLDVVGEIQGKSYLFVSTKDAIYMGGMLIMLPPSELEATVSAEEFSEDSKDAYGEIANIIAGVYTGVFEAQYIHKIRFVRTDLDQIAPMKVDIESDEPVPDVEYYLSSMSLLINGEQHGQVNMLFPAALLNLDAMAKAESEASAAVEPAAVKQGSAPPQEEAGGAAAMRSIDPSKHVPVDILIISDDEGAASGLVAGADARGFAVRTISFKDNIRGAITPELKAIYIVMSRIDEQAFGMIIKVNSSCSLPLIAAGPQWTKSKVIKAVKYGITDILLTPASGDDILENLENNLVKLAA